MAKKPFCVIKSNKSTFPPMKLILIGMISGFVSGFFGAGGGIVLIIFAELMMKNDDLKDIFARTAVMTALFSIVSAFTYLKRGVIPVLTSVPLIIPAFSGGVFGAFMLDKIPKKTLKIGRAHV